MDKKSTAAIILNGTNLDIEVEGDYIICADGGYKLLRGEKPDIIIGDFDSLDNIPEGIEIIKHNAEKNQTDGEICIEYAAEKGYKEINIYAALGGRIDHVLGNMALLKLASTLTAKAIIREKGLNIYYAEKEFSLETKLNEIVSVVPFGGEITIKESKGLFYPLQNLNIKPHQTRGISNITTDTYVHLDIAFGSILVFHYYNI